MLVLTDEYAILRDMKIVDREVFFYIAERTDKKTAISGVISKISRAGIALDISERMEPGRRNTLITFSADDVKNAINRLIGAGLLESLSDQGQRNFLVVKRKIFADYLGKGSCAQKQVTRPVTQRLSGQENENSNINNDLRELKNTENDQVTRQVTR
ncbi:MAG: hypothetical protein C0509_07345, partial [Acinetobacter sp.]|nr:hypothetical protein [Acinetobacter sp.]